MIAIPNEYSHKHLHIEKSNLEILSEQKKINNFGVCKSYTKWRDSLTRQDL